MTDTKLKNGLEKKPKRKHPVRNVLLVFLLILVVTSIVLIVVGNGKESTPSFKETIVGEGQKQALVIFKPSNNDTTESVMMELAEQLSQMDYTVTVNQVSEQMTYDFATYDLLAFGTPVYMGNTADELEDYISNNSVQGKRVLLVATGMNLDVFDELTAMSEWFDESNQIDAIKVGKADSNMFTWFLSQCEKNWSQKSGTGYFSIHDTADSEIDAVTGATMKK